MLKAVILGFLCFIIFLVLHILIFRTFELKERFRALAAIFFAVIPLYVVVYALLPTDYLVVVPLQPVNPVLSLSTIQFLSATLNFLSGLMLYIFLFLGYCQFYFIVDRSISVRVMIEIDNADGERLSYDDIMRVYSFHGILRRRLDHMLEDRFLVKEGEFYRNTSKGRAEAKVFRFLKDFLKLGPGG